MLEETKVISAQDCIKAAKELFETRDKAIAEVVMSNIMSDIRAGIQAHKLKINHLYSSVISEISMAYIIQRLTHLGYAVTWGRRTTTEEWSLSISWEKQYITQCYGPFTIS